MIIFDGLMVRIAHDFIKAVSQESRSGQMLSVAQPQPKQKFAIKKLERLPDDVKEKLYCFIQGIDVFLCLLFSVSQNPACIRNENLRKI